MSVPRCKKKTGKNLSGCQVADLYKRFNKELKDFEKEHSWTLTKVTQAIVFYALSVSHNFQYEDFQLLVKHIDDISEKLVSKEMDLDDLYEALDQLDVRFDV